MSDDEGIEDEFAMDVDEYMDDASDEIVYPSPGPSTSTVPLKGRKRFLADLEELKKPVVIKLGSHGYALKSACYLLDCAYNLLMILRCRR